MLATIRTSSLIINLEHQPSILYVVVLASNGEQSKIEEPLIAIPNAVTLK